MAELSTIARPYAKAAFEFALQQKALNDWSVSLVLATTIANDSQVKSLLNNPAIDSEQLLSVFLTVGGTELEETFKNFLKVLSANGRLAATPDISLQFDVLKAEHERTIDVELTSAVALNEEQQKLFADKLSEKLGREVTIQNHVDTSIIGGLLIKAEDMVIDGTVRGKIAKLTESLAS